MHKAAHGTTAPQDLAHGAVRSVPVPLERGPRRQASFETTGSEIHRMTRCTRLQDQPAREACQRSSLMVMPVPRGCEDRAQCIPSLTPVPIRSSGYGVTLVMGKHALDALPFRRKNMAVAARVASRHATRLKGGRLRVAVYAYPLTARFTVAVPRTICLRVIVGGQRAFSTTTVQLRSSAGGLAVTAVAVGLLAVATTMSLGT
jgi:hypothetical protein